MYGTMYMNDDSDLTISVGDTWTGMQFFTQGSVVGVTTDTADATADHFTIPAGGGGDYLVSYSATVQSNVAKTYRIGVAVNGTVNDQTVNTIRMATSGVSFYSVVSGTYILSLSATDEVALYGKNATDTTNMDTGSVQFSIYRISG
jgi:hypothetical protein